MMVVHLLRQFCVGLRTRDGYFLGIDYDHEIAQFNTRCKTRLVFTEQERGYFRSQASQRLTIGIHQQPLAVNLSSLGIKGFVHVFLSKQLD